MAVMQPHAVNLFRFLVAGFVLGSIFLIRHRHERYWGFQAYKQYGFALVGLGLLGYFLYQWTFIVGFDKTTAGNAAIIMASAPAWTAIVGTLFKLEKLSLMAWVGISVSVIGTAVLVIFGSGNVAMGSELLPGNILIALAAFLWGSYTALTKPLLSLLPPLDITFLGFLVALPFLFVLGYPQLSVTPWQEVSLGNWLAIVYSGALSIGLAVVVWNMAIKDVGASLTAVFGNLVPFIAVLAGNLLLDEAITLPQILGGTLILGGLIIVRRFRL